MPEQDDGEVAQTLVIVGCGSAKRDRELKPGTLSVKRYAAKDLYTSTYFGKKREYAETVGDQWMILSAHHGLLPQGEEIKPYDRSIDDLDDDQLDALAHRVGMTLIEWVSWEQGEGRDIDKIVVLAGERYLKPLRERDTFSAGVAPRVEYPLQQNNLGGIGEQMAWLKDRVETESRQQTRLVTDGGVDQSGDGDDRERCQGCAELVEKTRMNHVSVTSNRRVRYCNRCERLRDKYNILAEDHEQYRLPQLADELVEADRVA